MGESTCRGPPGPTCCTWRLGINGRHRDTWPNAMVLALPAWISIPEEITTHVQTGVSPRGAAIEFFVGWSVGSKREMPINKVISDASGGEDGIRTHDTALDRITV
jgi:hypothetical protein